MSSPRVRRALVSVSDKGGLADFCRGLAEAGVEIYSTGGTRAALEAAGLAVVDVSSYTGYPELLDGRLKTLHPKVHGGILCRHDRPDDLATLDRYGILTFELVVVNLYPFEATVARPGTSFDEAIEQIDIGGPTLVRAAAKNHAFTTIVSRPEQYPLVLAEIAADGVTTSDLRRRLAAEAFAMTWRYDQAISAYFARVEAAGEQDGGGSFPPQIDLRLELIEKLRYGENPHQPAAVYALPSAPGSDLVHAQKLNGKELSYNNLLDLASALGIVAALPDAAVAVIKHNNPCGAAAAGSLVEAADKAMQGDPTSAFGSVLGMNRLLDAATAEVLTRPGTFIEAIVAPQFDADALTVLTTRPKWKENVRLLQVASLEPAAGWEFRGVPGGFLVQRPDTLADPEQEWQVVTRKQPSDAEWQDLRFAWQIVRHVKSNAIVLCRDRSLLGVGAGQMSRVDAVEIAVKKAGDRARGAALGSDAFFPFADSIPIAAAAGVTAVIQPGGSKKDAEVIVACDQHGLAMIFTGRRHFKH